MAGLLDGVDARTQMVGANRLEMLLFRLSDSQLYGINVFKVQEVISCPKLTQVPHSKHMVYGIANMRGKTISVIDLSRALGKPSVQDASKAYVIIADYNMNTQGFLVSGVERILNMNWEEILPPPKGAGGNSYLTAVTKYNNQLVEILDVEKVLVDVIGSVADLSEETLAEQDKSSLSGHTVLVVDDSVVARKQIERTLTQTGLTCVMQKDGKSALEYLESLVEDGGDINEKISLVVSDVEMPKMDGYTLTRNIRNSPALKKLKIILHTSLSGVFNQAMVKKVGADQFLPKFNADDLANTVIKAIEK